VGVIERLVPRSARPCASRRTPRLSRGRPSEHNSIPPGIMFTTLCEPGAGLVAALDFSEPYGTLVAASSRGTSSPQNGLSGRTYCISSSFLQVRLRNRT
jgi:hypothetical protein